jgi:hypothetical protein
MVFGLRFPFTLLAVMDGEGTEGDEGGFEKGSRAGASVCHVARLVDGSIGGAT